MQILHQSLQKTDKIPPVIALHLSFSISRSSHIQMLERKEKKVASIFAEKKTEKIPPVSALCLAVSLTSGFHMVEKTKCQDSSSLSVAPHSFSFLRFSYTKFPSIFAQIRQKKLKFLHLASISRESMKDLKKNRCFKPHFKFILNFHRRTALSVFKEAKMHLNFEAAGKSTNVCQFSV